MRALLRESPQVVRHPDAGGGVGAPGRRGPGAFIRVDTAGAGARAFTGSAGPESSYSA